MIFATSQDKARTFWEGHKIVEVGDFFHICIAWTMNFDYFYIWKAKT